MRKGLLHFIAAGALLAAPVAASAQGLGGPPVILSGGSVAPGAGASCGNVSVSQVCFPITATWTTTGTYVAPLVVNVTDSGPANAASKVFDLQIGGVSIFNINKAGGIAATGALIWGTDATFDIGASGANRPRNLFLSGSATVGGAIVATGAISSNGNGVSGGVSTVAALPACNVRDGLKMAVSDATVAAASNFGAAVTGGGANHVPVYCDGTSWKIG